MSTQITKDIICPQCGETQKYQLYTSINSVDNPEMKNLVMMETLFDWRCSRCNYFADMAYPFLYTDPKAGYIICFKPVGSIGNVEPTSVMEQYIKRAVKNLAEMKEKILIFDSGYDDVAMELVKNALCAIIKNTYKVSTVHAYFSRLGEGELEFAVFLPRKNEPLYHSTKAEVYRQSEEVLRTLNYEEPGDFSRVDAKLARKILEQYKNI